MQLGINKDISFASIKVEENQMTQELIDLRTSILEGRYTDYYINKLLLL